MFCLHVWLCITHEAGAFGSSPGAGTVRVVSHYVGTRSWAQVLWKRKQYWPSSHLSSPLKHDFWMEPQAWPKGRCERWLVSAPLVGPRWLSLSYACLSFLAATQVSSLALPPALASCSSSLWSQKWNQRGLLKGLPKQIFLPLNCFH